MIHPWHDVQIGPNTPETVNCIIEIPKGTRGKYELDKETGLIKLDRVLFSSMYYPANYGFMPQTYCDDKDPLDALVLCQVDIQPMSLVEIRPIGVMQMTDGGEGDDKIIAVAANDPTYTHIQDLADLSEAAIMEIRTFFEDYKKLEKKEVIINGFFGKEKAHQIINESIELYKKNF